MDENARHKIIEIQSLDQPDVELFSHLTEAQLRSIKEPEKGIFIAESPKVIRVALQQGCTPVALLCERKHIEGDAAEIIAMCNDSYSKRIHAISAAVSPLQEHALLPVYTGSRALLAQLTGYTLTRGVLCAMRRPQLPTLEQVCRDSRRLVVIDNVVDAANIGAIFRAAAALGMDGVLLTTDTCDPFCRRAVRVSMGSVFLLPWTWLPEGVQALHRFGFKTAAMALADDSVPLDAPCLKTEQRLALIMGTEGDGLTQQVIHAADYVVRIPMENDVDSLNVAAAAAVAFWELRPDKIRHEKTEPEK